jgi:hypothetical protein
MLLILGHINFGEPSHNAHSLLALSVPSIAGSGLGRDTVLGLWGSHCDADRTGAAAAYHPPGSTLALGVRPCESNPRPLRDVRVDPA